MSFGNNAVKSTAKTVLKGKYLSGVFTVSVFIFALIASSLFSSVLNKIYGNIISIIIYYLLLIFTVLPLFLGTLRYFWRLLFNCNDKSISVFYYFTKKNIYIKALKLIFTLTIKAFFIGIIVSIPALFVWIISQSFIYDWINIPMPIWTANLNFIFELLKTFAFVFILLYMLRYYLTPFLFISVENIDIEQAIYMSNIISRKTSTDFVFLIFSVFFWIILLFLLAPAIFIIPYLLTIYLVHCRFCVAEYNLTIKTYNNQSQNDGLGDFNNE